MKILQVIPHYFPSPHFGGTPVACHNLSKNLVELGNRVDILTTDAFDNQERYKIKSQPEKIANYSVYRFRNLSNKIAYDNRFAIPIPSIKFLFSQLKTYQVIQLNEYRTLLNVIVCTMKPFIKAKYILYPEGTYASYNTQQGFKKIFDFLFAGIIDSAIDTYVVLSDIEKKSLLANGVPKNKIVTIDYGIDGIELKSKKNISLPYSYVLYLGRIDKRKGVDLLIKAYYKSGIYQKKVHLVIAGNDAGFATECRKLVRKYSLEKFVHFIGPVNEEKASLYKSANLVAYVTENETFGLVPIEAALCGTGSVVDSDSGVAKILKECGIGYSVKYGDVNAFARVLGKEGWKKNAVSGAKIKQLLSKYSWKVVAGKFSKLYQQV